MYHLRQTKTSSGATAVQVVKYVKRKMVVAAHIGSAHAQTELQRLRQAAHAWIEKHERQRVLPAFSIPTAAGPDILKEYEYLGVRYAFIYEILHALLDRFQFTALGSKLLHDLTIMRIIEPASKLRSLKLLGEYFGIRHRRQSWYESLKRFATLKSAAEKLVVKRAVQELNFDFALVFYDVTTLYYESFEGDSLRKPGFSKDNKPQQPQIVLGLVVNADGFPVAYEIFAGNTFEGHTLIPVIRAFKKRHKIAALTVVADAAMISLDNINALAQNGLRYIVGARLGNVSPELIAQVRLGLAEQDGATVRITTELGDLVSDFSLKRYRKDKREMEKQIEKAKAVIIDPGRAKRTKFVKLGAHAYELNEELMEKAKGLLGIKGYYTNLGAEVSDRAVVEQYHGLWRVEQAFRVAKGDLAMRPIFHFKEDAVKVHVLICFMALAVSRYMEIKTGMSLQRVIAALKQVTDATLLNAHTSQTTVMRMKIPSETRGMLEKLGLSY